MGWPSCHLAFGLIFQVVAMVPSGLMVQVPLSREGSSEASSGLACPCASRSASGLFSMKWNSEEYVLPPSNFVARLFTSAPITTVTRCGPLRGDPLGSPGAAPEGDGLSAGA